MKKFIAFTLFTLSPIILYSQVEEWVFTLNGTLNGRDIANAIVEGPDGNIYVAGNLNNNGTSSDLVVLSLTPSGSLRWIYSYNGIGNGDDVAYDIVIGDTNLYVAGVTTANNYDFLVLSLTLDGEERWVFRYDDPALFDHANSIVCGGDGNLYVTGTIGNKFAVLSLTTDGELRWLFQPNYQIGVGMKVIYGENIYACGQLFVPGFDYDFAVIGLTSSGIPVFVYTYNGVEWNGGMAFSLVQSPDNILYPVGKTLPPNSQSGFEDFTVQALMDGYRIWEFTYNGEGNFFDQANDIVYGSDGNLYVVGKTYEANDDFTVISLTTSGSYRWIYNYDRGGADEGVRLIDDGGNLYIAGQSFSPYSNFDITVLSLTYEGEENWVYLKDGQGHGRDEPRDLIIGTGNSLYVAGLTTGSNTDFDFTVIKLNFGPTGNDEMSINQGFRLILQNPARRSIEAMFYLPIPEKLEFEVLDLLGRKILQFSLPGTSGWQKIEKPVNLSDGVYILRVRVGRKNINKKVLFLGN
jgi:hypothetical protein